MAMNNEVEKATYWKSALGGLKISLHAQRVSRIAFTREYVRSRQALGLATPENRAFVEWRRHETPAVGAQLAVSVKFPVNYLGLSAQTGKPKNPLFTFECAQAGSAIEFGFFCSREPAKTLESKLSTFGKPLFWAGLDNGDCVSIVARAIDFDASVIPSPERWAGSMRLLNPNAFSEAGAIQNNLNAIMWNEPRDNGALEVIEIGGINIKRNN